jgi:hypothetical protein
MSWIDGRGYAHWGPRGMPGIDAILNVAGAALLLAHFSVMPAKYRRMFLEPATELFNKAEKRMGLIDN